MSRSNKKNTNKGFQIYNINIWILSKSLSYVINKKNYINNDIVWWQTVTLSKINNKHVVADWSSENVYKEQSCELPTLSKVTLSKTIKAIKK
jgi:hypothetical protein